MASQHHIFDGLTIRNTDVAIFAGQKEVLGAVGLAVKNCRFENVGFGVWTEYAGSSDFYIADNLFLGRERRRKGFAGSVLRMLDTGWMNEQARSRMTELGIMTIQNISQPVETLSGGQRQGVAVARAAAFESRVVIMDEPTAALGVKESSKVLDLIRTLRDKGLPIILISHDMPHVFEVSDRIHIQRLGRRGAVVTPQSHTMSEAVAIMTGATQVDEHGAHDLS